MDDSGIDFIQHTVYVPAAWHDFALGAGLQVLYQEHLLSCLYFAGILCSLLVTSAAMREDFGVAGTDMKKHFSILSRFQVSCMPCLSAAAFLMGYCN